MKRFLLFLSLTLAAFPRTAPAASASPIISATTGSNRNKPFSDDMKRILMMAAVLLAACCGQKKTEMKTLILYYSQDGSTKAVAQQLQQCLGADIEAVEPVIPYDGDFPATIARGRAELDGSLPEIKPLQVDLKAYDLIFLGYPIWFGTCATPILKALETLDFSGKKIVPFCSFGSGGIESSTAVIREKLPDTEVLDGYGVRAARIEAMPAEIDRFLKAGGFIEGEVEPLAPFSAFKPVTGDEATIFNAAVDGYPMLNAEAEDVASRPVPGGVEYLFTANDLPREGAPEGAAPRSIKVHVLVEDGCAPVFTKVVR